MWANSDHTETIYLVLLWQQYNNNNENKNDKYSIYYINFQ